MEASRICIVSTSPQMTKNALIAAAKYPADVRFVQAVLDQAVSITRKACEKHRSEAVLSLRGTAALLTEQLDIPVIGITPGTTRLARRINDVVSKIGNERKAVVTMYAGTQFNLDLEFIKQVCDIDISVARYSNLADLAAKLADKHHSRQPQEAARGRARPAHPRLRR
ncbi:MAG: PrpR N-terminal domain-containing protein [Mailhella sp.]|nr:PrpR N-terminal domain-containing protein [Mailhella sp.]